MPSITERDSSILGGVTGTTGKPPMKPDQATKQSANAAAEEKKQAIIAQFTATTTAAAPMVGPIVSAASSGSSSPNKLEYDTVLDNTAEADIDW